MQFTRGDDIEDTARAQGSVVLRRSKVADEQPRHDFLHDGTEEGKSNKGISKFRLEILAALVESRERMGERIN